MVECCHLWDNGQALAVPSVMTEAAHVMAMRGMTSEHLSQPAFLQDKGLNQGIPAKKPHGADKVRNEGHQSVLKCICVGDGDDDVI